ncbi:hypothetical protein NBRC10512_001861 [Rhodotorula toruloides]|uniref:RHTO0S19e01442g1_1 n=2 Tax=Rhodotorula toruloides TaxID=5286 RepID=A0A061BF90_RHOTO|nr:uncharacterized protein RHTO_03703 [Rhodotorula toruloides NP11]EMS20169.1 hypothetical protein RHTO_03703 [Rhodotorula toruloides NP11]CDR48643.1 RHTO0S19e01442g1_1 [Rhodotorula toruloides]
MLWVARAAARSPRHVPRLLQARPSSFFSDSLLLQRIAARLELAKRDADELAERLRANQQQRSIEVASRRALETEHDDLYEPLNTSGKSSQELVEDEEDARDEASEEPDSEEEPLFYLETPSYREADLRAELEGWERPVLTNEQIKALGAKYFCMVASPADAYSPVALRHSLVDLDGQPMSDERIKEARQCRRHLTLDILDFRKTWKNQDKALVDLSLSILEKRFPEFAYCPAEKGAYLDTHDKPARHLARWKAMQYLLWDHKRYRRYWINSRLSRTATTIPEEQVR